MSKHNGSNNGGFDKEGKGTPAPRPARNSLKKIQLSKPIVVRELSTVTGQKPFEIIADLRELGVFALVNSAVDFEVAAKVLEEYGYEAEVTQ